MNRRTILGRLLLDPAGEERDPFSGELSRQRASVLGMWLLILTLAILFAAAIMAFVVVRFDLSSRGERFVPFGSPGLPRMLLASTALLIASGVVLHGAVRCARQAGRPDRVARSLKVSLVLGLGFLVTQLIAWWQMATAMAPDASGLRAVLAAATANLYGWTFFVMTGLHAAHVVGGLVPLAIVTHRAGKGWYSAGAERGLVMVSMYWHFLDAAWIVLYLTLWLATG